MDTYEIDKIILILSNQDDRSTDDVISWLNYSDKKFLFLNEVNKINSIKLFSNSNIFYQINGVNILKNSSFWYRRYKFDLSDCINNSYFEDNNLIIDYLNKGLFLNFINRPIDNNIKKIEVYEQCEILNIKFPHFIFSNNLEEIIKFSNGEDLILKPMENFNFNLKFNNIDIIASYKLKKITFKNLMKVNQNFSNTFFQKYIDKKYEIRSFFLDNKFYSMAIFSQQNEKTKIDFRNYDYENPNRCIPYKLPKYFENKLLKLMQCLMLKSGSIDIVVSKNNEYYFLEVNPVGQFQWLSYHCNYYIEKKIAEKL
jgi:ATP-GRASP peptide maturase of grasp-with-spasm system